MSLEHAKRKILESFDAEFAWIFSSGSEDDPV